MIYLYSGIKCSHYNQVFQNASTFKQDMYLDGERERVWDSLQKVNMMKMNDRIVGDFLNISKQMRIIIILHIKSVFLKSSLENK